MRIVYNPVGGFYVLLRDSMLFFYMGSCAFNPVPLGAFTSASFFFVAGDTLFTQISTDPIDAANIMDSESAIDLIMDSDESPVSRGRNDNRNPHAGSRAPLVN